MTLNDYTKMLETLAQTHKGTRKGSLYTAVIEDLNKIKTGEVLPSEMAGMAKKLPLD